MNSVRLPDIRRRLVEVVRWILPRIPLLLAAAVLTAGAVSSGVRARDAYREYEAVRGVASSGTADFIPSNRTSAAPILVEALLTALDDDSLRDAFAAARWSPGDEECALAAAALRLEAASQSQAGRTLAAGVEAGSEETAGVGPSFGELLKLADARRASAEILELAAATLESGSSGQSVSRLVLAARGSRGTVDAGFERFAESYGNRQDSGRLGGGGAQTIRRLLRREALLAFSRLGITGERAQQAAGPVAGRLRAALRAKRVHGPTEWRERSDVIVWEASRSLPSGVGGRIGNIVNARLVAPGYRLERPEYDLTITFESARDFSVSVQGEYEALDDSSTVVVDGNLSGSLEPSGRLTAEGRYEIVETNAFGRSLELGSLRLSGARSRTGFHLGSLTLNPDVDFPETARTLTWSEVALPN